MPIEVGIIGLGRIASLLEDDKLREKPCTHAGAVLANPDCVLVAGCDIDAERRTLFTGRHGVPAYDDAGAMLAVHQSISLLIIATHPDSHREYCELAAKNKIPVAVCEKPLAASLRDARKIAALTADKSSDKSGTKIVVNHERRYSADYQEAKALLEGGTLGAILSVNAKLCMGKNSRLIDVLWHDGTHLIDAVLFLCGGKLKHRKTFGAKLRARNDTAYLFGELVGSAATAHIPFVLEAGAGRDSLIFEIELFCERGRLRIGNGIFEVWQSEPCPYAEKFRSLKKTREGWQGKTGYFANMLADAVACVRDTERQPISNAKAALNVIEYLNSL